MMEAGYIMLLLHMIQHREDANVNQGTRVQLYTGNFLSKDVEKDVPHIQHNAFVLRHNIFQIPSMNQHFHLLF